MEFNVYLKKLRKEKNLTLTQLALESGVSQGYLSHVENCSRGIPSAEALKKLSGPLKVSLLDLMEAAGYIEKVDKNKINKQHVEIMPDSYEIKNLTKEEKEFLEKHLEDYRKYHQWMKQITNGVNGEEAGEPREFKEGKHNE